MRARGYVLTEALVAVAIGGVMLTALMALNVDFIALARRVADRGETGRFGARLEAAAAGDHRCERPGAVLAARDDGAALVQNDQATAFVTVSQTDGGGFVSAGGASGRLAGAVRVAVRTAPRADGAPAPGRAMAAVEAGGEPVAVLGLRCDLPEICDYDPAKGVCRGKE